MVFSANQSGVARIGAITLASLATALPVAGKADEVSISSVPWEDGWIRESGSLEGAGGTTGSGGGGSAALRVGSARRGQRLLSIVSFDTSALPDDAVVESATLELTRGALTGVDPFLSQSAVIEVKKGAFGPSRGLESADFESESDEVAALEVKPPASDYAKFEVPLTAVSAGFIDVRGRTQYRFSVPSSSSSSSASYLGFYSGESSSRAPKLRVTYRRGSGASTPTPAPTGTPVVTKTPAATPTPAPTPIPYTAGGIWKPKPGVTWQWQLTGEIDTSLPVEMYDIDLFDASESVISSLKARGKRVVCYFSAGAWENWRPDASSFPSSVLGATNGWPGERWLDMRNLSALGPVMQGRLDLAKRKGCDGVEPDNIDGYTNRSGFPLTYNNQLAFNKWLAAEAHARGLSIGLKNDLDQVKDLVDHFDWALNEQCFQYNECEALLPFVSAGKAVFGVEYQGSTSSFCPKANAYGFSWLFKNLDLDAYRVSCGPV